MTDPTRFREGRSRREVLKSLGAAAAGAVTVGVVKAQEARADHGTTNYESSSPTSYGGGELVRV